MKHLFVKHNLVWAVTQGQIVVLPFSSFKDDVVRQAAVEETKHCIEMRLKSLSENTAILTADNQLFKLELTAYKLTVTRLVELEDELDPILFINKMVYQNHQVLFLTTMLGSLVVYDLDTSSLVS